MNTKFYKIDLNKWNRSQYFYYFTKMMPLSITVHHATCDGYHVSVFLDECQEMMNNPEK